MARQVWVDSPTDAELVEGLAYWMQESINQYDSLLVLLDDERLKHPAYGQDVSDSFDHALTMMGAGELFYWIMGHPRVRAHLQREKMPVPTIGIVIALLGKVIEPEGGAAGVTTLIAEDAEDTTVAFQPDELARARALAGTLPLYLGLSESLQAGAREMVETINDRATDADDREMCLATLAEMLHPSKALDVNEL